MKVLSIRFCKVSDDVHELAEFLESGLGLPNRLAGAEGPWAGSVFPASDDSWIELWPETPETPACVMLQIVVDDADAWAERARSRGLEPRGPSVANGERIYFLRAPTGLPITFQSKVPPPK